MKYGAFLKLEEIIFSKKRFRFLSVLQLLKMIICDMKKDLFLFWDNKIVDSNHS